jgi:ATP-binding cassette subfamily F protein 1
MQQRTTNTFSGGWRMRISLARALFMQPSLLLLDEPTNHLDLRAVLWLEEYLQRWKKTLVVVSHDRDFLNTVSTDIIHLHDQKLDFYRGNFVQFEQMYEQRKREANKKYEKYEKQMKEAKKSGSKDKQKKVDERIKEQSKQKSKGKSKHQTDNEDSAGAWDAPRKWHDYHVKFEFPEPTELSPPLIQMQDAKFQYPNRDDFVMQDLNLAARYADRVWVLDQGRLVADGGWAEVMRPEVLEPVYGVRLRPRTAGAEVGGDPPRPLFEIDLPSDEVVT